MASHLPVLTPRCPHLLMGSCACGDRDPLALVWVKVGGGDVLLSDRSYKCRSHGARVEARPQVPPRGRTAMTFSVHLFALPLPALAHPELVPSLVAKGTWIMAPEPQFLKTTRLPWRFSSETGSGSDFRGPWK